MVEKKNFGNNQAKQYLNSKSIFIQIDKTDTNITKVCSGCATAKFYFALKDY